jgi:hydrogenase-4 component H
MFNLLRIVKNTGDVTVKYPFAPLELMPAFRGKPEYDPKQCIACAACTMACPANALTMETDVKAGVRTWQLFVGRCIFCGRCEEVCPTHALTLSQMFELAVANKADLYERATFSLCNCRICNRPFAPRKEVEYVMALMVQAGIDANVVNTRRSLLETCPECRRRQNILDKNNIILNPQSIWRTDDDAE